jgi:hypothetical protein
VPRWTHRCLRIATLAVGILHAPMCWAAPSPDHPRILLTGARLEGLKASFMAGTPAARRFRLMVEGQVTRGNTYAFSAHFAALLSRLNGDRSYADYAVSFIDKEVAAEEQRMAQGFPPRVARDSYLYVGEVIGDLALTYDWCFDRLTEGTKKRWVSYANQAVANVWNHQTASWGGVARPWSGWSVNNPGNNYYYSFLEATMLLGLATKGENPRAETWLTTFRETKVRDQLVPYLERELQGGGSREGTGYGTAMARLFRLYDLWEATTGERISSLTPHAKDSLLYLLHATVPTLDRLAPIGDHSRDSTASLFDYHRSYLERLVWLFRDDPIAGFGASYLKRCSVPQMGRPFMYIDDYVYGDPRVAEKPLTDLYPGYHATGAGHVFLRSSWAPDATWLGFVAGPFTENHAHNDQGSFLVYKKSWLAYDQNIQTHSGIRQEASLHNLVRLEKGGQIVKMKRGAAAELLALSDSPEYAYLAARMTPLYAGEPGISSVERAVIFLKPNVFLVYDSAATNSGIDKVWTLNSSMKPASEGKALLLRAPGSSLTVVPILPLDANPKIVDWREGGDHDMLGGFRTDIPGGPGSPKFLTLLSLDGAVKDWTLKSGPPTPSVALTLTDGRTVVIRLKESILGGQIEIRGGGDAGTVSTTFSGGVAKLPLTLH